MWHPFRLALSLLGGVALLGATLDSQPAPSPSPARIAFDQWLGGQARRALDARRARVQALTTTGAIEADQHAVRAAMAEMIGVLPASDAPLNARVTRTTARDGYRIEHLVFESLPGFAVTALVYVPDGSGRFPAVLGTAGHADEGKASATYQHAWVSLARRGFLVLAYDPPGQGERYEYVDPTTGKSRVGAGTREHTMTGQQVLLTGRTMGAYMVQDGRRALDYLRSRQDVDPDRIAVAGNSGGGTQAALLGAVEPRLAAVVVSCYMTSWSDMWTTPGPQDAEQILPGFVSRGFDFADFAVAAAPRGYLVSSAIQDFFPIAGSRQVSAELARLYATLGAPEKLARVENDATHGWSQPLREGAYRALGIWLGRPGLPAAEAALTPESIESLRVTSTGQLATSGGTRTVRSINADEARALARSRPALTDAALRSLMGPTAPVPARVVERHGEAASADGEQLLIEVEPGVRLRGWLRRPAARTGPSVLLVDERGATRNGTTMAALVASGHTVLGLDVRGTGDLAPTDGASGYSGAYQFAARAWLLGSSVVAWQARDLHAGLQVLRRESPGSTGVLLHAGGHTVPSALFAAQGERLSGLVLEDGLVSFADLAMADTHDRATLSVMPGVLRVTDLPELMERIAPVPVRIVRPRSATGASIPPAEVATRAGRPLPTNVTVEP